MTNFLFSSLKLIFSNTTKDSSLVFFGNLVSSIFGIIFTIFAAKWLGPENWGAVAAIGSLIPILVALGDLGIGASLFQYTSGKWIADKKHVSETYATALSIKLLTLFIFTVLLLLVSPMLDRLYFNSNGIFIISIIGFLSVSLLDFQIFSIEAKQKWVTASLFISLTNIIRVFGLILLVISDHLNLINVLYILVGSTLLVFIITIFALPFKISFNNWRSLISKFYNFSFWMSSSKVISTVASRVDVLILIQVAGAYQAGIYGAASRLAIGVPLIVGSFATVIASRFASIDDKKTLILYFKKSILLSVLIVIGVLFGILCTPLVVGFLGSKYTLATALLQWLFVGMIPFVLSAPAVNILIYHFKKPKIIAYLSVIQFTIVILINYIFIPSLGFFAPIIALGVSNTITLVVTYYFSVVFIRKKQ